MFDLEGETGLVVRGIGTAVTLVRSHGGGQEMDNGVAAFAVGVDRREHHAGRESVVFFKNFISIPPSCLTISVPLGIFEKKNIMG